MKFFIFLFTFFYFSPAFAQLEKLKPSVKGPQIRFDHPEIIDTITLADLDTNCMCVAGDNKYVFTFTNAGNEPLIVQQSSGSDPDFNCMWTHEPIKPGGKGLVIICAWQGKLMMDKTYHINDNSVTPQTIHIKRVPACDSAYKAAQERYAERVEMKAKYGTPLYVYGNSVSVKISSLPEPLNSAYRDYKGSVITLDTTRSYYNIDTSHHSQPGTLEYDHTYVPHATAFRFIAGNFIYCYNIKGELLQNEEILSKKPLTGNEGISNGQQYEYNVRVIVYQKGKESLRYTEKRKITERAGGY